MAGIASECYSIIVWKVRDEYVEIIRKSIGRQVSQATVAGDQALAFALETWLLWRGKGEILCRAGIGSDLHPTIRQDL